MSGYDIGVLIAGILVVMTGTVALWVIAPRLPKGTIFLIAVAILVTGILNFERSPTLGHALAVILFYLGIAGMFVALADIVRSRKGTRNSEFKTADKYSKDTLATPFDRPMSLLGVGICVIGYVIISVAIISLGLGVTSLVRQYIARELSVDTLREMGAVLGTFLIPTIVAILGLVIIDIGRKRRQRPKA